jgi:hypothetical protein
VHKRRVEARDGALHPQRAERKFKMAQRSLTDATVKSIRAQFEALEARGPKRGAKAALKLKLATKHHVTVATIDRARNGRTYKTEQKAA